MVRLRDLTCCYRRRSSLVLCLSSQMLCSVICPKSLGTHRRRGRRVVGASFHQSLRRRGHDDRNLPAKSRWCKSSRRCMVREDRLNIVCQAAASSTQSVSLRSRSGIPNKAGTVGSKGSSFFRRTLQINRLPPEDQPSISDPIGNSVASDGSLTFSLNLIVAMYPAISGGSESISSARPYSISHHFPEASTKSE